MAYDSIIQTGSFSADGNNKTLKLRSDVDKLVIENQTEWSATNNGAGFRYTWYRSLGTTALMEYHPAADHTVAVDTSTNAITLVDMGDTSIGAARAVTAGTNVTQPVFDTGTTTDLHTGTIVRVTGTDQINLNGLDFSISNVVAGTSFKLENTLATAPGIVAGANGYYRIVAQTPGDYSLFTSTNRNIANITQAASAVVTTLVDHDFVVGQRIKFAIPSGYGMSELDGLTGAVTAIATSTFTVDIDSTGFTAFKFPTYTEGPYRLAVALPIGDAKSSVSQNTPGKFSNQGYIGVVLSSGATSPAGSLNDDITWTAYKAVS